MKTINKAVVISDLHLGVNESLFYTQNQNRFLETMTWLTKELSELGEIDELIFLGDLFDLSLSPYDILYADAKKFFERIAILKNVKEIVFIPGNHDHHLWVEHVEKDQIVGNIKNGKTPNENDYFFRLVDSKYPQANDPNVYENDILLNYFIPASVSNPPVLSMKYANHLRQIGEKLYLFNHGHFLEDAFTPLQFLFEAVALEDLETFNLLWLEAFDYHLGHSGRLSDKVREIYHDCIINKNRDEFDKFIKDTLAYLKTKTGLGKFWIWAIKKVLNKIISKKMESKDNVDLGQESAMRFKGCSDKLKKKIEWYIKNYIINRYRTTNPRFGKNIPFPFTFVFGHTHDYFSTQITIDNNKYDIFNTGGWTVDKDGNRRDSGILVIDGNGCVWKKY